MRKIIFIITMLAILSSCTPTLTGTPLTQKESSPLPQKETTATQPQELPVTTDCNSPCGAGTCIDNTCVCDQGAINCQETCITGCCTQSDCPIGKICENQECKQPLPKCKYLEQANTETRQCDCGTNNKWCEAQGKCIPQKACCAHSDCKFRDNECGQTSIAMKICITDGSTLCKTILEGVTEKYELANVHTLRVNKIMSDGILNARVDEADYDEIVHGVETNISNVKLLTEKVSILGGECKQKR